MIDYNLELQFKQACENQDIELIDELIKNNPETDFQTAKEGVNPILIDLALQTKWDIVEHLINNHNFPILILDKDDHISIAISQDNIKVFRFLKDNHNLLSIAISQENIKAFKFLYEKNPKLLTEVKSKTHRVALSEMFDIHRPLVLNFAIDVLKIDLIQKLIELKSLIFVSFKPMILIINKIESLEELKSIQIKLTKNVFDLNNTSQYIRWKNDHHKQVVFDHIENRIKELYIKQNLL